MPLSGFSAKNGRKRWKNNHSGTNSIALEYETYENQSLTRDAYRARVRVYYWNKFVVPRCGRYAAVFGLDG